MTDGYDDINGKEWESIMALLMHATSVHRDHDLITIEENTDAENHKNAADTILKHWVEMVDSMMLNDVPTFIRGNSHMNEDTTYINPNVYHNDMRAIERQRGRHWQSKTDPESMLYYTRLCDGNYRRIGDSEELPERLQGRTLTYMAIEYNRLVRQVHGENAHKRMLLTEDYLPDYIQCDSFMDLKNSIKELSEKVENPMTNATTKDVVEITAEDMKNVGNLIDRRTARLAREVKHYSDAFHNERKVKDELLIENRTLKAEIAHLKRVGRFPVNTDLPKEASDREKRFLSIDV